MKCAIVVFLVICVGTILVVGESVDNNLWLVQLRENDESLENVDELAKRYGYRLYRKLPGFGNTFLFERQPNASIGPIGKRSGHFAGHLHHDLLVKWADQQVPLIRSKRDLREEYDEGSEMLDAVNGLDYDAFYENLRLTGVDRKPPPSLFNDELWSQQWYVQDTRTRPGLPKLDLNVLPVWDRGITGAGIRVAVLDDGIEHTHDDLRQNYDAEISYDVNHDHVDPRPNYPLKANSHGTRCAGEIAMTANNRKCGVGIAYNSRIGGIKLLGGNVFDMVEGMALGHAYDKIDVYSSSWGPTDNGKALERPGRLATYALQRGIREGRAGRGSIFIWASGNGGSSGDNCNCDGYAASIYTVTIGSASQRGTLPWYGEKCPAILAVTYSSGAYQDQMITTTDVNNQCTVLHTGTSASAPLAAGIVALTLEANGNLTWRDIQHLIVFTSEFAPLQDNIGWQQSAASLLYNVGFGFGLMNADAMVKAALNWINVPDARSDSVFSGTDQIITSKRQNSTSGIWKRNDLEKERNLAMVRLEYSGQIRYLEHVEVTVNVKYTIRGSLSFYLTSPGDSNFDSLQDLVAYIQEPYGEYGTRVQLLAARPKDRSPAGFLDWKMMSVATWSEDPAGEWLLEVTDNLSEGPNFNQGRLFNCTITVHGTKEQPNYLRNGPRQYDANYIRRTLY